MRKYISVLPSSLEAQINWYNCFGHIARECDLSELCWFTFFSFFSALSSLFWVCKSSSSWFFSNYLVLPLEFVVSCFYLSMWFLSSFVLYISPVWGLLTWFWLVVSVILDYYLTRVARFSKEKLLFNWNSKLTECPIFYLATLCLICYLLPQSSVYLMWHN